MGRVPLAPPIRFGTVAFPPLTNDTESETSSGEVARVTTFSEGLYRGAYPKQRNLRFLETLHLRTIVSLTPKPLDQDGSLAEWAHEQNGGVGVRLVHVRTEKPKEETGGLTREGAARAMLELLNRENLPLYVHCLDGVEATSVLVACLRKIQGWTDGSIRAELARGLLVAPNRLASTPYDVPKHLAHFVDHYGIPDGVLLPQRDRVPAWLWPSLAAQDGWRTENSAVQHPSLQIHFERSEHYIATQRARFGAVWSATHSPRSRTPSSLSASDLSEPPPYDSSSQQASRRPSDEHPPPPHQTLHAPSTQALESTQGYTHPSPHAPQDEFDLRTPRARPVQDVADVPPLAPSDPPRTRAEHPTHVYAPSDMERTPLVSAQKWPERTPSASDTIPPFGLDTELHDEAVEEDEELVEEPDEEEEEEDPSQVLDALDLEGYA